MGLIKAIKGAVGSVAADQWKEYFYCDALDNEVLASKGRKRVSGRGSNTKGDENIITNGSVVTVNEGQCMIIVDQGKVVEFCAEAGEFVYDTSSEPSLFYGSFGESLADTFETIGNVLLLEGMRPRTKGFIFSIRKRLWGINMARRVRCLSVWWMRTSALILIFPCAAMGSILIRLQIPFCFIRMCAEIFPEIL